MKIEPISVSDLNKYMKDKVASDEYLKSVFVRGEISNFKHHYTGHMYFTLKDENSLIKCIMFKSSTLTLNFVPKDGMPSSHSAVVATLTTLVGKEYGLGSAIFAVSFVFSLIVMYDAAGVRRAAGKQATLLNKLVENYPNSNVIVTEKLVEVLGHTPFQVLVGAVIGILVGTLYGIF